MRIATAIALVVLLAFPAAAETWSVPGDFDTIQEAVANAREGDTIQVGPGTYTGAVSIDGLDSLTLRGKGAILDAAGALRTLLVSNCRDFSLSGFSFTGGALDCLRLSDVSSAVITKCTVDGTGGVGIHLIDCADLTISGCTVSHTGSHGIQDQDSVGLSIMKNRIEYVDGRGMDLSAFTTGAGTRDSLISGNTVAHCDKEGISFLGSGNAFLKNRITDATGFGLGSTVTMLLESSGNLISGNALADLPGRGISVSGNDHEVSRNKVERAGTIGIYVAGDRCEISGNTVTGDKPGADGIDLTVATGSIEKNKVLGPGDAGLRLLTSSCAITGNSVAGGREYGFYIAGGGSNTFLKNKCSGSGILDLWDWLPVGSNDYSGGNRFGSQSIGTPP